MVLLTMLLLTTALSHNEILHRGWTVFSVCYFHSGNLYAIYRGNMFVCSDVCLEMGDPFLSVSSTEVF